MNQNISSSWTSLLGILCKYLHNGDIEHPYSRSISPSLFVRYVENCSLKDDDLAGRMGLQAKELNKLMAVLGNDRLVHVQVTLLCNCPVFDLLWLF